MWRAKAPDSEQVTRLRDVREKYDLKPLVIHDSYLINLASPPSEIRDKSIAGFAGEMERAIVIGADYLVAHPGNYKGLSAEQGILNAAEGLARAWQSLPPSLVSNSKLTILLENTAGAGAQLGGALEELATIRELASPYLGIPIGFCLDTCHCFVAGFDVASTEGLETFVAHASEILGLEHVPIMHANDAKTPLGSHVDRHAHIGAGYIGLEGFRRILNHPKLRERSFILETPVDEPGDDLRNVTVLKELVSPKERSTPRKSSRSGSRAGRTTRRCT